MRSVYEPEDVDSDDAPAGDTAGEAGGATGEPAEPKAETDMSRRRQWLVVAALVVSGILAPAYLYFVGPGSFGLGFRDTYLAIPMIPALLMGAVGVWTAVRR
ncbi:hypothetical protein [Halobacterium zhouii]|uniref:hypothetical protein n=1 Tax=Halobacterium zhouii TaxID=2902624 RepID=UPI001E2A088F|nr:hypothetical protein [Halobacterium zhouii]